MSFYVALFQNITITYINSVTFEKWEVKLMLQNGFSNNESNILKITPL